MSSKRLSRNADIAGMALNRTLSGESVSISERLSFTTPYQNAMRPSSMINAAFLLFLSIGSGESTNPRSRILARWVLQRPLLMPRALTMSAWRVIPRAMQSIIAEWTGNGESSSSMMLLVSSCNGESREKKHSQRHLS